MAALLRKRPPAPNLEFDSVLTGQTYKGAQAIRAADVWETLDYFPEVEEFIDAGEHVVEVSRISGRGARSGVPVTQRVAIVWTFQRGVLVRGKSFSSRAEAFEAVGLRA